VRLIYGSLSSLKSCSGSSCWRICSNISVLAFWSAALAWPTESMAANTLFLSTFGPALAALRLACSFSKA
jgi:hypothetical protein